jgi:hypothetical protein
METKKENTAAITEHKDKHWNVLITTILIGLIFGFFVGRMWSGKNAGEELIAKNKTATTTKTVAVKSETAVPAVKETKKANEVLTEKKPAVNIAVATLNNSVTLSEQTAGNMVSLTKVALAQDGWVVIHEDANGELGRILGAAWFPKGVSENVSVELLRNTISNTKYYAVLYSDNGDKKFDSKTDRPITENGKDVLEVFMTK